jgi:hypothetical protein
MSHIEKKKINGRYYLYRYQSYRDVNGRVRKRMLEYLGPETSQAASKKTERYHLERKKINGRYYLYRYQSYRDANGKVKKRMLDYLGPVSASSKVFGVSVKGGGR